MMSRMILACAVVTSALAGLYIGERDVLGRLRRSMTAAPDTSAEVPANERYAHRTSLFREFDTHADVVMLGDSITEMADWRAIFPDVSILNRGIGYDSTAGVLARLDTVLDAEPVVTFVMLGTNDFLYGGEADAASVRYVEIIDRLSPATEVVILSTLYVGPALSARNPSIAALNASLEAKCAENACRFLDLNAILAPDGALSDAYTVDGVHLNGPAYRVWAEAIAPALSEELGLTVAPAPSSPR